MSSYPAVSSPTCRQSSSGFAPSPSPSAERLTHPHSQLVAKHFHAGTPESFPILISVTLPVAFGQRDSGDSPKCRLQCWIDTMGGDMLSHFCVAPREAAKMQVLRHALSVVHRVVVPEKMAFAEVGQ